MSSMISSSDGGDVRESDDPILLRGAIDLLEMEVETERNEREALEEALEEVSKRLIKFEEFSQSIEGQTQKLQSELRVVTAERDSLLRRMQIRNVAEEGEANIMDNVEEFRLKILDLTEQLEITEKLRIEAEEKQNLQQDKSQAASKELQEELELVREELSRVRSDWGKIEKEHSALTKKLQKKVENVAKSEETLLAERNFMRSDVSRLEEELAALHEDRRNLQLVQSQLEAANQERTTSQEIMDELEEELATLRNQHIPELVKEHQQTIDALTVEVTELRQVLGQSKDKYSEAREIHQKEVEKLSQELAEAVLLSQQERGKAIEQSERANNQREELERKASNLREEIERFQSKQDELSVNLSSRDDVIKNFEANDLQLIGLCDEIRKDINDVLTAVNCDRRQLEDGSPNWSSPNLSSTGSNSSLQDNENRKPLLNGEERPVSKNRFEVKAILKSFTSFYSESPGSPKMSDSSQLLYTPSSRQFAGSIQHPVGDAPTRSSSKAALDTLAAAVQVLIASVNCCNNALPETIPSGPGTSMDNRIRALVKKLHEEQRARQENERALLANRGLHEHYSTRARQQLLETRLDRARENLSQSSEVEIYY